MLAIIGGGGILYFFQTLENVNILPQCIIPSILFLLEILKMASCI